MAAAPSALAPDATPPYASNGGAAGARPAAKEPIAILAPTGSDATVTAAVLSRSGFTPQPYPDVESLAGAVQSDVGALLVAEEALWKSGADTLLRALEAQESWSDVPLVVLTSDGELSRVLSPTLQTVVERANVTLLERPVRVATLVTTLRSALRARRRQFQVRDYLAELRAAETERARLLRVAEAQRAAAEEANRAKSEFLAVMSHELRTPLNAIGGYAELLDLGLRGPVTPEQQADLARIRRSQQHLLGLINDVLNFTRVAAGHVEFDVTDVPVAEVLTDIIDLVAPQAWEKGLTVEPPSCPPDLVARADREKLRQVVVNLLSNAVKFTDAPGRITVSCTGEAATVEIRVTDTGIGIPGDRLEQIFEPFVQVDPKLTRRSEGTGLGLAISRDLARGMSGELTAESTPGAGSTFLLVLPRALP